MFPGIKQIVSIIAFSLINFLFSFKYLNRLDNYSLTFLGTLFSVSLPAILFFIYYYYSNDKTSGKIKAIIFSSRLAWFLLLALIVFTISFFIYYPQESLNIDRFEMITLFWDNLFSGKCPYCPRSEDTNIPGPFPFYFYISLPWYLIGEIGLISLLGVVVLILIIKLNKTIPNNLANTIILILLTSPAVIYEITCRSTIFLNSVLILCLYIYIKNSELLKKRNILGIGCATGMVMSTRSLSFLFIFLIIIFKFRKQLFSINFIMLVLTSIGLFTISFIPVLLTCKEQFVQFNPFTVQASLVPIYYVAIIAALSLIIIFFIKRFSTFCWFSGVVCLALFTGHFYLYGNENFVQAILLSKIDISYVSFSIPFLLYSMFDTLHICSEPKSNMKPKELEPVAFCN